MTPGRSLLIALASALVGVVAYFFLNELSCRHYTDPDVHNRLAGITFWVVFLAILFTLIFIIKAVYNVIKNPAIAVVVIVAGLLLVAAAIIPNFLRFSARANECEAKQNLLAIYAAYQSYHSQYQTYPSSPSIRVNGKTFNCLDITGWKPSSFIRYTYDCFGTAAYYPGWDGVGTPNPMACGLIDKATQVDFTVGACGNTDNDTTLDEWTIDNAKHLRHVLNDKTDKPESESEKKWWQFWRD